MEGKTQQSFSHFRHSLEAGAADDAGISHTKSSNWARVVIKTSTGSPMMVTKGMTSQSSVRGQTTERLEKLTTIHNVEILKGIPLCLAMGSFGRIFGMGGDPLQHMAMSRKVVKLQDFISHNWVVPRYVKWASLALHYNVKPAVVSTCVVQLCASLLLLLGFLPPIDTGVEGHRINWNFVLGNVTFFVILIFWHDIRRVLPPNLQVRERMTFVDKSCIHQTDRAKMIEGIKSLAGFLRSSDNMIVCCGPQYFRKLWTVYEIASFLSIHLDPNRIKLYPTTWAKPLAILSVASAALSLLKKAAFVLFNINAPNLFILLSAMEGAALMVACSYSLRTTVTGHERTKKDLSTFDIRNAHCSVESDRTFVEANVGTFMRELGRVPEHAQRDEALDAFNHMVHTDFLSCIADVRTELSFLLLVQAVVVMPRLGDNLDAILEWSLIDSNPIMSLVWFVANLELLHIVVLIGNVVAVPLLSRNLELTSWRKHLYLFATAFACLLAYAPVFFFIHILSSPGEDPGIEDAMRLRAIVSTALLQLCLFGLTVWTCKKPCCRRRHLGKHAVLRPGINVSV